MNFQSTKFSEISDLLSRLFLHHHLQVQAAQFWFSLEFYVYLVCPMVLGILEKDDEGDTSGLAKKRLPM